MGAFRVKIRVRVCNSVPSKHQFVTLSPEIVVEDDVLPGETPAEAYRRLANLGNVLWAKELLSQIGFADRRAEVTNKGWCDEYLSSVGMDHPVLDKQVTPVSVPDSAKAMLKVLSGMFAQEAFAELQKLLDKHASE